VKRHGTVRKKKKKKKKDEDALKKDLAMMNFISMPETGQRLIKIIYYVNEKSKVEANEEKKTKQLICSPEKRGLT